MYDDDFGLAIAIAVGFACFFTLIGLLCAAVEDENNEETKREGAKYALEHKLTDKADCEFRLLTETTRSNGMWLAGCYEAVDVLRARK